MNTSFYLNFEFKRVGLSYYMRVDSILGRVYFELALEFLEEVNMII
jgi:hypothetical protein